MGSLIEKLTGNLDDESKKKIKKFSIIFIMIFILIIILSIIFAIIGKKTSYTDMEVIMEKAAYEYYKKNPSQLPNSEVKTSAVSAQTLVEQEYMKDISKYTKDESCSGNVVVTYIDGDYNYQGYLECNKFRTSLLVDKIKNDNPIVESSDGLYNEDGLLRFRGDYVNNYLKIGNEIYRIMKIDNDNKIYITIDELKSGDEKYSFYWDDRYNTDEKSYCGVNEYSLSRIKKSLNSLYDELDDLLKKNIVNYELCFGKRSPDDSNNGVECLSKENAKIGLMPISDYMKASIAPTCVTPNSKECCNYNYLHNEEFSWWTMTGVGGETVHTYSISFRGEIEKDRGDIKKIARYVVALDGTTVYSKGNGSKNNPYEIR